MCSVEEILNWRLGYRWQHGTTAPLCTPTRRPYMDMVWWNNGEALDLWWAMHLTLKQGTAV